MTDLAGKPMRDALIGAIHQRMGDNPDYFFLSADMGAPALDSLRAEFPDRFINVGIAEQNMINVAAGLAMEGFTVFTYAIAPFYLRAFEQIRINLALPAQTRPMNVNMLALGAGLSYDVSGPTHHCLEDLSAMRALPNLIILSPADSVTALAVADFVPTLARPKYIRLDGKAFRPLREVGRQGVDLNRGFAELRAGDRVCLVATGVMVGLALQVADRFPGRVGVVDVFRLDDGMDLRGLFDAAARYPRVVSLEEAFAERGGLDSLVAAARDHFGGAFALRRMGMRHEFDFMPGSRATLHDRSGIGPDAIAAEVVAALA